jgi:hypothetical protein
MHPLLKHSLHWLCLLVALLALAACGPGTGGTGTGPNPTSSVTPGDNPVAGFTAVYSGTATSSLSTPVNGTQSIPSSVTFTCVNGCTTTDPSVNLQLQTDSIVLTAPCITFTYAGPWSVSANGTVIVQGNYQSGTASPQTATMVITFTSGSTDSGVVTVTITQANGTVLLAPANLQRGSSAPPALPAPPVFVDDPNCLQVPAATSKP